MTIDNKLTIEEAIKTLQVMGTNPFDTKWKKSLWLGIDALEREKILREMVRFNTLKQAREAWKYVISPLPSEGEKGESPSD